MSSFTNALIAKFNGDGKTWTVDQPFRYYIGAEDSGEYIDVRIGFKTNMASIPRLAQWLIPKMGKWDQGAVVHDLSYRDGYYIKDIADMPMPMKLTRKRADQIFIEAMKVLNVKKWRRYLIYSGVRIGGWIAWNKYRAKDIIDYPMDSE